MKKILITTVLAFALGTYTSAQIVITNDYSTPNNETNDIYSQESKSNEIEQTQGGMDVQYHAIENGWGIGLNYVISGFVLGFDYLFGKKNDYIRNNGGMEFYIGGNYRYRIIENFYVEGRVLAGYYYWKTEYNSKTNLENDSANKLYLGLSPRIGLQFGSWAISAGYRWDYIDFKFDKDHCLDRFNIGLTFGL